MSEIPEKLSLLFQRRHFVTLQTGIFLREFLNDYYLYEPNCVTIFRHGHKLNVHAVGQPA